MLLCLLLCTQALKSVATRSLVESKLDLGVNEPKVVEVSVDGMPGRGIFDIDLFRCHGFIAASSVDANTCLRT